MAYKLILILYMFRLTDFGQTGRILKVQNTFSSRKYPIFFSYDSESIQTYLTKVISSKDDLVIACFKAHINQNVLPYLHRKADHRSASLLTLPPEQGEAVLKIDEQAKNQKCEVIKMRIKDCYNMLKYYSHYHCNTDFRKKIGEIKKFLQEFEPKESKLGEIIKEMEANITVFSQLLDEIDQIKIEKPEIKEKVKQLVKNQTDQQQDEKFDHLLLFLQQLRKKEGMDEKNLKSHLVTQLKSQLQGCLQILEERKNILKDFDYYQKEEYSDKIECIYWKYEKESQQLEQQERMVYESNVLFLTKQHVRGMTLREMIISKDERLTPEFCLDLAKTLLDLVLLYGGVKDLFLTTENIIIEECGTFHINYFSLVGLEFLKLRKYVSKADFLEILPYLTFGFLYSDDDTQLLLRFIVVNFVSAFLRRDMVFDAKAIDFEFQVQMDNLRPEMRLMDQKLFPKVLSNEDREKIKKQFDNPFKVRYAELVEKVFSANGKVSWEFLFSCLSRNESDTSRVKTQSSKQPQSITVLDIVNDVQNALSFGFDGFYVVAISLMEVFDHFTSILDKFGEKLTSLKSGREKIGKIRGKVMVQRAFFMKQGWYTKEIFIPVKCSMTYTQILDYSNWVQMLHLESRVNLQTIKGVQNLLQCLLDLQDTLVAIEPHLDDQFLEDAFSSHQCFYHANLPPDGKVKSYYNLLQNYLASKSKKQKNKKGKAEQQVVSDDELHMRADKEDEGLYPSDEEGSNCAKEEQEEDYNFKKYFWRCSFATLHVVYELIRNYYLRIHEISFNGAVTINGGRFAQWMQNFNPKTPPLVSDGHTV